MPKFLVNADGSLGARNDVALAGLLHKMGWRGTTSTMLNFGEQGGAVGYLIGEPNQGLRYMFHMMNEARIGVGMGATMLGYAGYQYSLHYAQPATGAACQRARFQHAAGADHPACRRAPHVADQKAYVEGALALSFTARRWSTISPPRATKHAGQCPAAAGPADADRQSLAVALLPDRQQAGDPDSRRLRLYPRLSGRAILPRQPAEPDPRRHQRHPGAGSAGAQGDDGKARR